MGETSLPCVRSMPWRFCMGTTPKPREKSACNSSASRCVIPPPPMSKPSASSWSLLPKNTERNLDMSTLHMEKITEHSKDFHRTENLYVRAFPANERTPICGLMRHDGHDFVGFYDKDENFCGFASLLTYGGITHILYFAIDEQYREHGYGSEALKLMHTLYPKNRFIADLELDIPTAENEPQRHLRRAFYLRNGYTPSEVRYIWQGEQYEILVSSGTITNTEFENFWDHFPNDEDR
ncbi:MAG TPA: hypothetical protein DIT79_09015 [Ruminococcaceae bacterium]|nr:hypothetical protein [Oscillospiraceae bacterium]